MKRKGRVGPKAKESTGRANVQFLCKYRRMGLKRRGGVWTQSTRKLALYRPMYIGWDLIRQEVRGEGRTQSKANTETTKNCAAHAYVQRMGTIRE